jgi:cytochrome P450
MGWDFALSIMPYGQRWRTYRRAFHQMFRPDAVLKYRPVQLSKIHDLLRRFAENPKDFREYLRTLAALRIEIVVMN